MTIKFEKWKNGTYVVARNEKGHFVTYRKQKGSGIKTKEQAVNLFTKYGSFTKDTIKLRGEKNITIKDKSIISKRKIGKNTYVIHSKDVLKKYKKFQYISKIYWGKERKQTTGYSNFNADKSQSLNRAIAGAIKANIITYDYKIEIYDNNVGVAVSPDMKVRVMFEYKTEVMSYVYTK
jgi:hypothetical protein